MDNDITIDPHQSTDSKTKTIRAMRISALYRGVLLPAIILMTMMNTLNADPPRKLNNFVTEYYDVESPKGDHLEFTFEDEGWIFIRVFDGASGVRVMLDEQPDPVINYEQTDRGARETMRFISAGTHAVKIEGGRVGRIQVRKVPEIRYCRFHYDPWVYQEGRYSWDVLERFMLANVNTIVGTENTDHSDQAARWRQAGGRWIVETMAPGFELRDLDEDKQSISVDQVMDGLLDPDSLNREWIDGLLVDEYFASMSYLLDPTVEAVRRVHTDPRFTNKRVELYVAGKAEGLGAFVSDAVDAGATIALECYNSEKLTEEEARVFLKARLSDTIAEYRRVDPEIVKHMVIALGIFSAPPESANIHPSVNYRVFQDMEFHTLATDPAADGLFGVMTYTSGYADLDTLRWVARLYRHYCIEGNTARLSDEPYLLNHLTNPDFANGLDGWEVEPAGSDSIRADSISGFGRRQGRWMTDDVGDHYLVMRRDAEQPNVVRQEVINMEPGEEYRLVMFSAELDQTRAIYGNPTLDDVTSIDISLGDVDMIESGSYDHHYRSLSSDKPFFFNYHVRRFRPRSATSVLTISDWIESERERGNVGRETAINFVEIQRCLDGDDNE